MTEKSDPLEVMARGIAALAHPTADIDRFPHLMAEAREEARSALAAAEAAGMVMMERAKLVEWGEALAPFCTPDSWSSKMIDIDGGGPRYRCAPDAIEPHHLHRLDRAYAAMIEAASLAQQEPSP